MSHVFLSGTVRAHSGMQPSVLGESRAVAGACVDLRAGVPLTSTLSVRTSCLLTTTEGRPRQAAAGSARFRHSRTLALLEYKCVACRRPSKHPLRLSAVGGLDHSSAAQASLGRIVAPASMRPLLSSAVLHAGPSRGRLRSNRWARPRPLTLGRAGSTFGVSAPNAPIHVKTWDASQAFRIRDSRRSNFKTLDAGCSITKVTPLLTAT